MLLTLLKAFPAKLKKRLLFEQILYLTCALVEASSLILLFFLLESCLDSSKLYAQLEPFGITVDNYNFRQLILLIAVVFVFWLAIGAFIRVYSLKRQWRTSSLIGVWLAETSFVSILSRPYSWHVNSNSGELVGNLTEDVTKVVQMTNQILVGITSLFLSIAILLTLFALSPLLICIIAIAFMAFYLVVYLKYKKPLKLHGVILTTSFQDMVKVSQEALGSIREILIGNYGPIFKDDFSKCSMNYRRAFEGYNVMAQTPKYILENFALIVIVCLSMLLFFLDDGNQSRIALLGPITLGSFKLLRPMQQCFVAMAQITNSIPSLQNLMPYITITESKPEFNTPPSIPTKGELTSSKFIDIQNLSFAYTKSGPFILNDINLSIYEGEKVAFVGSTGSGKSTLVDLIMGLLQPTSGLISVEDKVIDSKEILNSWQSQISHVPQQIHLGDISFASNIAFGERCPEKNIDLIIAAAKKAKLHEIILESPEQYNTVVGERGLRLSGGQRQRIGLARAFYRKSRLLVLDEATSALDSLTEQEVMTNIYSSCNYSAVIMIAHRLTTIKNCDRIFLLDHGNIVASGSYDYLRENSAFFRKFLKED